MSRVRPARASCALAAAVLAVGVSACSSDKEGEQRRSESETVHKAPPAEPPAPPETAVRVLDGDSLKPVEGALVTVARRSAFTGPDGIARLEVPRKRVRLGISAPAYGREARRLDFRQDLVGTVQVWRPDLQWPMYGVTTARTQVHSGIKVRPPFRVVWNRNLHGLLEFPAVVWNGVAYVNNIHGTLTALSMRNGRVLWSKRLGTLAASSPAVDAERGVLVVTTMSPGNVNVISMKTGHVRWRYATGRAEPSPVIRDGVAYFAATNGSVYALDLDRRRPRWIFRGGAKITSSPALVGNRVYIGDYAGRVFALNARTGHRIWTGSAGSRVYGTVAVAGGRVFAPSVFSGLSALSARSGRLLWRIPSGAYLYSSPAVFRNRVYFGTYAGLVYCADARSGHVLWTRPAGGRVSGGVEVVAGLVYAASLEFTMNAWHWRTGRRVWTFPRGQYVPVSGNGSRLLLHGYSRIWAVRPKHGR